MPFRRRTQPQLNLLILDKLTALPAAAYSTARLSRQYAGAAIRVRRSSDNTEADIGFVNNALDAAALLAFVGAGDGFVQIWYDQINGKHLLQNTQSSQAKIVSGGSLPLIGGKPAIVFANSSSLLAPAPMANLDELDIVTVHREDSRQNTSLYDLTGLDGIRGSAHFPWADGNGYSDIGDIRQAGSNARISGVKSTPIGTAAVLEFTNSRSNNTKAISVDGNPIASGQATVQTVACSKLQLGFNTLYNTGFAGSLSEFLVFDRYLNAADRTLLTADMRSRYSI